jgi:hypothetical protein
MFIGLIPHVQVINFLLVGIGDENKKFVSGTGKHFHPIPISVTNTLPMPRTKTVTYFIITVALRKNVDAIDIRCPCNKIFSLSPTLEHMKIMCRMLTINFILFKYL